MPTFSLNIGFLFPKEIYKENKINKWNSLFLNCLLFPFLSFFENEFFNIFLLEDFFKNKIISTLIFFFSPFLSRSYTDIHDTEEAGPINMME